MVEVGPSGPLTREWEAMRALVALGGFALTATLVFTGVWDASHHAQASASDDAAKAARITLAGAPPEAQAPVPLTVLLMGDSYTAGNGARAKGDPAYYGPERCMRSTATWGEQYAGLLEDQGFAVTMMNRACSAATADAVLNGKDMKDSRVVTYPEPEVEAAPRSDEYYASWAASTPRCEPAPASDEYFTTDVVRSPRGDGTADVAVSCHRRLAPQVDSLNRDVDLVLLTLGGNDAHFPDIVRACLVLGEARGCQEAVESAAAYVNDNYRGDLIEVFTEIVRRTEGHARIAYLAYPGLEVNDDVRVTQLTRDGLASYAVSAGLAGLAEAAVDAQRDAVDAVNAAMGAGTVTFVDEVPALFDGHEPDARPAVANPERWIYEVFETTIRDEWYHLKAAGHSRIAELVATEGAFGARDDNGRARDVALLIGDDAAARDVVAAALADQELWRGARVAIVEQRVADGGAALERRIVTSAAEPADALVALRDDARAEWGPAGEVRVRPRWNAATQVVHVGTAGTPQHLTPPVWGAVTEGGVADAAVEEGAVANPATNHSSPPILDQLVEALERAASAPHAWAGGPYVVGGGDLVLTASGSVGEGRLEYSWDLDGDGEHETSAQGPRLRVPVGSVESGWVRVRVTAAGGASSTAGARVSASSQGATAVTSCDGGDALSGRGASGGRQGCGAAPGSSFEREGDPAPSPHLPAIKERDQSLVAFGDSSQFSLSLVPVYADARLTTMGGFRTAAATRAGDRLRRRPTELVLRERGLRALLGQNSVR